MVGRLGWFTRSVHVEIQERAASLRQLMLMLNLGLDQLPEPERPTDALSMAVPEVGFVTAVLESLVADGIGPVSAKAQRKVPLPEGLDLKKAINKGEVRKLNEATDAIAAQAGGGKPVVVSFTRLAAESGDADAQNDSEEVFEREIPLPELHRKSLDYAQRVRALLERMAKKVPQ